MKQRGARNSQREVARLLSTFAAVLLCLTSANTARAVQVKRVYRGLINYLVGDTLKTAPIGGTVDTTKSIVLVSSTGVEIATNGKMGEGSFIFQGQLAGNDTVQLERNRSDVDASAAWQVVEFADGVKVQSGISSLPADSTSAGLTKTITLQNAILPDTSRAVPIVTVRVGTGASAATDIERTNEFFVDAALATTCSPTCSTTLTLSRFVASSTTKDLALAIAWQVVEFNTDANVYTGRVILPVPGTAAQNQTATNDGSSPASPCGGGADCSSFTNATAFSPALSNSGANALLFFFIKPGSGLTGQETEIFTRGTITGGSTVSFTRGYAPATANTEVIARYYVVDFMDGSNYLGRGQNGEILYSSGGHATSTPTTVVASGATAASPTVVTTSAAHGYAAGMLANVSGFLTTSSEEANGSWIVCNGTCASTTFDEAGSSVSIASSAVTGTATGKAIETALTTTVNLTRTVSLVSAAAANTTSTLQTLMDDLSFVNYLYTRAGAPCSGGTCLGTIRDSGTNSRTAVAANLSYFTYEFPSVTLSSPNGGAGAPILGVDALQTITFKSADSTAGDNWELDVCTSGCGGVSPTWTLMNTCSTSPPTTYDKACTNAGTGLAFAPSVDVPWKVPDNIGTTVRLRAIDTTDTTPATNAVTNCARRCDASNGDFTIRGQITNVYLADTTHTSEGSPSTVLNVAATDASVKWTAHGSIGNVDVILDNNPKNGLLDAGDLRLATGVSGTAGSWSWNPGSGGVNDLVNTGYVIWVKEQAATDPTGLVQGTSGTFEIRPSIAYQKPDIATIWNVGKCRTIQWTTTGTVNNIKIEYLQGVSAPYVVASNLTIATTPDQYTPDPARFYVGNASSNNGCETQCVSGRKCYDWQIPDTIEKGASAQLHIFNPNNTLVTATGPTGYFEIKPSITITEPNLGTEKWKITTSNDIKFSIGSGSGVSQADISYSKNGLAGPWNSIVAGWTLQPAGCATTPPCIYPWTISATPDPQSANVRIKVADSAFPSTVYDTGPDPGDMQILAKLSFSTGKPATNQIFKVGDTYTSEIEWVVDGDLYNAPVAIGCGGTPNPQCLELVLLDSGNPLVTIATGLDSTPGAHGLPVAKQWIPTAGHRTNVGTLKLWKNGNNDLSVISPAIKVKTNLKSLAFDSIANGGSGHTVIANSGVKNITWAVDPTTEATALLVKYDTNSGLDGYLNSITCGNQAPPAANTGLCTWTLPDLLSSKVRLKIEMSGDAEVKAESTGDFRLKGQLTLTYPSTNSGDPALLWLIGDPIPQAIKWTYKGSAMGKVKGYYALDGITFNRTIFDDTANVDVTAGTGVGYTWNPVPLAAIGTTAGTLNEINPSIKVKLIGHLAESADVDSISAQPLTIKAQFTGLAVRNSGTWARGDTTQGLDWVTKGDGLKVGSVNCRYSIDGTTFTTFFTGTNAEGCTWLPNVNGTVSNTITYRVESATNPWSAINPYIVLDSVGGNTIKAKITGFTNPLATDIDASSWRVGAAKTITWTADGDPGNVKIYFSRTGTFPDLTPYDVPIFTGVSGSGGTTASWTVPDTIDLNPALNDEKFRIECETPTAWKCDALNSSGFNVKGSLTMLNNTGSYAAQTGQIPIKWKYTGMVGGDGKVSIYLEDNGTQVATVVSAWNYNKDGTNGVEAGTTCTGVDDFNACTYNWSTPVNVGTKFRFRIKADADPTYTQSLQTADFEIQGGLTMTYPAIGGSAETWYIGDNKTLTWNAQGSLGEVTISYTFNGITFTPITSAGTLASAQSYPWNPLPNNVLGPDGEVSSGFQIKIVSNLVPSVSSISTQPITVKARLASLALVGGTTWTYGDAGKGLSWTTQGDGINTVHCQYSTDGTWPPAPGSNGTFVSNLALAGSGAASCTWSPSVAGPISNALTYRVISVANPTDVVATTAGGNTIKGKITINNPAGGATWIANDTTRSITWAPDGAMPGNVDIFFAPDGVTWGSAIATVAATSASWAWPSVANAIDVTTPNPADEKVKIACTGATAWACDPVIMSSGFNIKGQLTVQNNAGPYNAGQATIPIQWTYKGGLGNIVLKYDTNNGNSGIDATPNTGDDYPNTIATVASNYDPDGAGPILPCAEGATCQYDWATPSTTGTAFRLKIAPVEDTADAVYQTASFIIKGSITLTGDAVGGSSVVWNVGSNQAITWNHTGNLGQVNIKYSKNNGTDNYANPPLASPTVTNGSTGGSWSWNNIPLSALKNGEDKNTQFKIRVEQVGDETGTYSVSTNPLTIVSQFGTTAGWPNGGQTWYSGESKTVTWDNTNAQVGQVLLRYSTDGGTSYPNLLTGATTNTGSYGPFTVNIPVDDDIRLRVESADSDNSPPSGADEVFLNSAGNFTVKGKIVVTAPAATDVGASALRVGNDKTIQWTVSGAMGTVKILFNNGVSDTIVRTGVNPADQSCCTAPAWTVPDEIAGNADNKIKIECEENFMPANTVAKCVAAESGLFEIDGQLTLKEPNGGDVYAVGQADIPIKWTYKGNLGTLQLRYDSNSGGDTYPTIITSVAHNYPGTCTAPTDAAPCVYNWTTYPSTAATTYRVKILPLSPDSSSLAVTSNTNFAIRGDVVLVGPGQNQGSPEVWTVNGGSNTISWYTTGGITNVDFGFNTAGGAGLYTGIVSNYFAAGCTAGSPCSYTWAINPVDYVTVTSDTVRIRVNQYGNGTIKSDSTYDFKIKPRLVLATPNNNTAECIVGGTCTVGAAVGITWDPTTNATTGQLGNVTSGLKINFSTNGGLGADLTVNTTDDFPDNNCATDLAGCLAAKGGLIAASAAVGAGTAAWTVPDIMTNQGVVRISKVGDAAPVARDDSDSFFFIKGSITNVQIKNSLGADGQPNTADDPSPGSPIDLPIATTKYVTWDFTGSLGSAKVYYATVANPGPADWQPPAGYSVTLTGGSGSSSYAWVIPNAPSPNVKVKVEATNADWQTVSGISPGYNSIIGSIAGVMVIADGAPATTNMEVTGNKTIQWTPNGAISLFKIEYRCTGGNPACNGTWVDITNPPTGTAGTVVGSDRQWTWSGIPDRISNDVDFQVSDYSNPTKVNAQSSVNYIIKGKLSVASPLSTDVWTVGTTATPSIRWSKQGTIGDLKIEYSTSGTFTAADVTAGYVFTIVTNYASGVDGANDYAWPAGVIGATRKISDTGAIRISNITAITGTELVATSAGTFKIRPSLTNITSPTGTSLWNVGDTNRTIDWACNSGTKGDGSWPKVILEYGIDGGGTHPNTVSGAASLDCVNGTNSYPWPSIPPERTNGASVKISYVDYTSINLVFASFKIYPVITVQSMANPMAGPNFGTNRFPVANTYNNVIKWTRTGDDSISFKVLYASDGATFTDPGNRIPDGATLHNVASGATGVSWIIPETLALTNTYKIRVVDADFPDVYGDSAAFKLMAGLSLTGPTGSGTTLIAGGATNSIGWNFGGQVGLVKAYYSLNGTGGPWNLIDQFDHLSATSGSGTMNWNMSTVVTATNTARVKVEDAGDPDVVSEGADFKIGLAFNLTAPEGAGAVCKAEDLANPCAITWSWTPAAGGGVTDVKLEYTNNASDITPVWTEIDPATVKLNTGTYSWNPVPGAWSATSGLNDLSNDVRLRISQKAPFNDHTLVLNAGDLPAVKIEPTLTVTVPAGGESLLVGTGTTIKFKKKGAVQSVDVYYSYDGSAPNYVKLNGLAVDISGAPDGNGEYSFPYTIPTNASLTVGNSGKIKVKVVSPSNQTAIEGISNGFQIKGSITLVGPTGATDLIVGGSKTVEWTPNGNISKFRIQYKTSAGGSWTEISPAGGCVVTTCFTVNGANRTWSWTNIPDAIGNDVWLRVADYDNDNVAGASAAANVIKGILDLQTPDDAPLAYYIGDNAPITWRKKGSIGNIKIEQSAKGDFTDTVVINSSYASGADDVDVSLSPVWTAPSKVAETFKIRITNNVTPLPPAGTELTDISTAAFGVRPKITGISSPGSGNTWNVGDTAKVITWSATSATKTDGITLPKVKFQYLVAGGTWTDVLDLVGSPAEADCANGTNNYTWVRGVADERSDDVKIRVYFMDYAGTSEGLDSPSFKIYPVITVSNPIGTDQLVVGTNYANLITWSRTGTKSGSFKVLYSTDGTSFPDPANVLATLQTVTNGTTGVSWNIPAATALTNTAKIRVIDEANTNVYGDSAAFKLKGGLTLTAPAANATVTAASTTNTIGWNFTGGIGNVTAKYDPNSGLGADGIGGTTDDYPTTIGTKSQAGTSGSSTLNWDLSSAAGGTNTTAVTNTGRIKIVDDADPTNVLSTVDVKIGANLDLTAPESGALCYAEDPCTISWNSLAGTGVTDVKLEYTNNDSNASPTWVEIDPAVTKANISPYIWTPTPGTLADLANDNRMRLSQKAPLNAAVVSTGTGTAFRIKAALDVTVPGAGTESWDAGSPYVIKFKKKGAVQTVNLYYDHNNGLGADGVVSADDYATLINNATPIDLSLLTPDAQGQYSYTWTIASATPLTAGFAGKIKAKIVTPASQNDVFDVQTNSIEVKGAVTLLTPTATGIILDVGQDYAVTWSKSGAVNNVKLHYSRTGGIVGGGSYPTDDSTLMTTVPSTPSSYTWAVPDKIGTNLRIRVMDAGNANVWNESTNAFRIRGKLLLTQPDLAGISWTVGSSQTISWTTTGTFSPVQLDYATDGDFGGTNVFPVLPLASVTNCTASATVPYQCTGSASFTIEDKITAAAKVRIRGSGSETDVASISTNAFKIGGSITAITSPAAGDVWVYPDTTKQIKWTANGTITNVKIAYKTSVGGAYTTIVASDPGHTTGNNTYTWSAGLPDVNTEDAYIQVCDANAAFSSVCLDSAAFRIRPSITVTSPTAGQELVVGTTYNNLIKWSYTGTTITSVKVLYSTSTGTSYPDPDNLITASTVVGNGTAGINWVIPDSLTLTSTEKIKVQDLGNSNVFGESPAFKLKGGLTLSGPSGSGTTIIAASTTNTISWTFTGAVANAKAYYSLNGTAGPWTLIGTKAQTGTSGSSTLNWDLSSAVGGTNTTGVTNTARVKITDAADETNVVSEGADFSIGTQFSNVHPANGEPIYAEDTGTDITWNPGPGTGVTDVKLEYTNNASSGSAWTEIDPGVGKINNGTYRWSPVPGSVNDLQNDNKIRISQKVPLNASSAVMGIGPGLFPIRPTLTVTVPGAGTESWDVGSTHAIKFKKTGAVQKVDVYYAPDALPGPPTWTKLNTTLDPAVNPLGPVDLTLLTPNAQGEYTWTWTVANNTPLTSGFKGKIKVKVFDPASQQSVEGVQANAIEVKGAVTLLTPNGGGTPQQTLVVGSTYTINGTVFGAVSQVQLSISTGGAYNPLSAGNCDSNLTVQPDQTFSCNWTVQNLIGTNLKIRAQDANNANVKDESDGAFAIKGGVTITAPVGGGSPSVWIAGDQHDIAWTLNGSVGLLDLFYNVNDGSYQPIASGVDPGLATGGCSSAPCYRWTLPGNSPSDVIVSSNVKVKISGSTLAADEISGAFRVKGKLTIGTVASEYVLGNTVTLTWTAKGDIGPVKVEYYDGGAANGGVGWQTVTLAASQNGPQPVTLDTKFIPSCSSGCLGSDVATNAAALRITDADEPSVTSTSASFLVKPLLQVSSPIITDRWVAKSSHPITWTFKGSNVGTVKVDYATNAASTNWQPILETEGTADDGIVTNDGSIPWTVADAITYAPAKLVVRLSTQPPTDPWAVTATSAPANVIGALELIQPNDATGIAWRINSSSNQITWKPTGTMTSVNLEYSTDSGSTWPPLGGGTITTTPVAAGTDGLNQSYFWTIPMTTPIVKDTLRIRVCDATITDICDVATAPSSFLANFTVSSPAGGNVWVAESTETISWTTPQAGVPATVKLEYSLNGVTFVPIPETYGTANDGIVANTGTQNVTLGPELSTSARGRISDPSDPNSALVSDPFKIRGALDLKAPDGGQAWEIGTYNLIRWTKKGNITAARLQYTKDATATPTVTWENLPDGETPPRDTQNISVTGPPDGNGEYTFNWKIPDLPGINVTTAKIQVLDASDGTVLDPSAAVFTIKGRVDLTSPDGGLTYGVGANLPIVGTVFGPIATVRVRYSTDDGATYPNANIPTGCGDVNGEVTVAGDRTFSCNWTLPDAVGQNLKVRVCDTGNSTVCDYSTTAFFVKGTLTIINPASGGSPAVWIAGDPQDITWSRTGNIGNVDLFYNVNGGAFAPIASAIDAALATGGCTPAPCYRWTVPDGSGGPIVSSAVKVKIIGGNLLTDAVTGDFKVKGKLTLNYPDGPNLTFTLRDSVNVSWTAKGDIGPVKVEYFDGSAWQTVTTAAAQNGPQPVSLDVKFIPSCSTGCTGTTVATDAGKFRITDPDEASVTDETTNPFMVKPYLLVTNPSTGNEVWVATTPQTLTWDQTGSNIGTVKIEYSSDGGSTYNPIVESEGTANDGIVANDGSFGWTVLDNIAPTTNKKFRFTTQPAADPWAEVKTSSLFKIVGQLTLLKPDETDNKWGVGTTHNITWSFVGTISQVILQYAQNGVDFNTNITPSPISGSLGSSGFAWTIDPATTQVSATGKIRIVDANDGTVTDTAPNTAPLKIVPVFTVTAPADSGGSPARWTVDPPGCTPTACTHQIKWTTQGQNSTVNLYYWKASTCATIGGAGTVIGSGLPDTSTAGYNWQVPDPAELSTGPVCARVQVTYPADETVFANSNNFWIVGGFKVVAPNGSADKWDVGSNQTIRWTSTSANIGTAKVYYATNGNATPPTWNELTAIAPNTGAQNAERAWAWNILPPTMTDQFKVKVAAANDPDASDESDISGKIKAYVHVNQPSAANITGTDSQIGLRVGDTYPITWATDPGQGSVPYVKLTYSTNANDPTPTWEDILDGASLMTPNDGSFTWTVPDAISSTVKIRVMNADDPDAVDISDNTFKIRGYFTLTQPNGGEPFKIYDATQNPNPESITWSTMGNVTSVDLIAYSTNPSDPVFRDGGGNVYTLSNPLVIASGLTNTPNGTTTFPWQVPDKASPSVKVKVINPLDPTVVYIDSAATFRIQGSFTVTYPPDANQVPAVGDQVWITWNKTGSSITQAKISYSTAGPSGPWNAVVESPIEGGSNDGIVANDGSFLWTVPDAVTISPTCYIKIEDPNDSTVNHVSANSFKIKAKYVFVSPPSGPPVRWVTNENRLISWTSSSSRTVNLIYSKDGFNSDTHPIASAVASSVGLNSLAWPGGVPDDRSQTVKIRITDAADPTVSLDSDYFKIEHYQITFEVRDQLSNNFISTLTANGANSNPLYTWAASGLNAPIVQPLPAGSWNVTFTQQDYGDKAVPVVADHDQTVTVYMESKVVHVWEVNTELSYDTVSDRLFISMVLKRDGVRVPGAVYGGIEFWDGSTLSKKFETSTTTVDPTTQAITPTSQVSPNAQGFYNFTWDPPTGLVSGKIYNVVATIINLTGGNIVTPRTFSITQAAQLQSVTDTVNQKLDTSLSQVNTNIQNTLTGQTTTLTGMIDNRLGFTADDIAAGKSLKSELAAQTGTINTATEEMKSTVQAGITNFTAQVSSSIVSLDESVEDSAVSAKNLEKAAADSQQSADNLEKVGKKYAARLLLPTAVLIGETLPIRYRAGEGLAPLVDIFTADADGKTITVVKSKPLIENTEKKGLYEFSIKVTKDAGFNPGKPATIFVKEETTGNLEAGAVFVETTTLGALEGLIASNSGSKAAIQQTLAAVNAVKGTLATGGDVGRALELLRTKVERIPKAVAEEGGTVQMRRTVSEVAERIKQLAGEEGYDFSQLVKKGMEEAPSIKDIRKKTDEVQGATELMQVLMERKMGGIDAPVVHVQVE